MSLGSTWIATAAVMGSSGFLSGNEANPDIPVLDGRAVILQSDGSLFRPLHVGRPIMKCSGSRGSRIVLHQDPFTKAVMRAGLASWPFSSKRARRKTMSYVCHSPGFRPAITSGGY